jgi:hypothetical protein
VVKEGGQLRVATEGGQLRVAKEGGQLRVVKEGGELKWEGFQGRNEINVEGTDILGERIGSKLYKCEEQMKRTKKRTMAAMASIKWIGVQSAGVGLDTFNLLADSYVCSVVRASVTTLQMKTKWYEQLDIILARGARWYMDQVSMMSRECVMAEMGRESTYVLAAKAKVRLWWRMKQEESGEKIHRMMTQREIDIKNGETEGWMYQTLEVMREMGIEKWWGNTEQELPSKERLKEIIRAKGLIMEQKRWVVWGREKGRDNNNIHITKPLWGKEEYLGWGQGGKGQRLKMAWRCGCCNIGGNKVGRRARKGETESVTKARKKCRLCGAEDETEIHLMLECVVLERMRGKLLEVVDKCRKGKQWRRPPISKAQIMAGILGGDGVRNISERRKMDQQVKEFLVFVERVCVAANGISLLKDEWRDEGNAIEEEGHMEWYRDELEEEEAIEEVIAWMLMCET